MESSAASATESEDELGRAERFQVNRRHETGRDVRVGVDQARHQRYVAEIDRRRIRTRIARL
jgi:hypothetical protein